MTFDTINNFTVWPGQWQRVSMPRGARILSVHRHNEERVSVEVSALVDANAPKVDRLISVVTADVSGLTVADMAYVGMVHDRVTEIGYHVFDGGEA